MHDAVYAVGTTCGDYQIVELIGSGGFADVYHAVHQRSKEHVALKCLKVRHSTNRRTKERMAAEATLLTRLRHRNVVRVYEAGSSGGVLWMAMEHLAGKTLRDALSEASEPLSLLEAIFIASEVAAGIAAAHDLGVIHRDLKPENIMIVGLDVKVLDMGAAKYLGWGLESTGTLPPTGTPLYMAPEHILGKQVDARADVYALGVIAYEMCAGRHPLGPSWDEMPPRNQIPHLQVYGAPVPLTEALPGFPLDLSEIIQRSMEKDPDRRFGTMRAFGDALRAVGERLLAEQEKRSSLDERAEERRAGFRGGARSIFSTAGAAALGGAASGVHTASKGLLGPGASGDDGDDYEEVTREVHRPSFPTSSPASFPASFQTTMPLPNPSKEPKGSGTEPLAGGKRASRPSLGTELLVDVGPFPSPLPPDRASASQWMAPPTALSGPSAPLGSPAGRFRIVAMPIGVVLGVALTLLVAVLGGIPLLGREQSSKEGNVAEALDASVAPLADKGAPPLPEPPSSPVNDPALPAIPLEPAAPVAETGTPAPRSSVSAPPESREVIGVASYASSAPASRPAAPGAAPAAAPKSATRSNGDGAAPSPTAPPQAPLQARKSSRIF